MPKPLMLPSLHVVEFFDRAADGRLVAAGRRAAPDAEAAHRLAAELAAGHAGAVAWSWLADPETGEHGPLQVHYRSGSLPDRFG